MPGLAGSLRLMHTSTNCSRSAGVLPELPSSLAARRGASGRALQPRKGVTAYRKQPAALAEGRSPRGAR
jgi:hypothetical protein